MNLVGFLFYNTTRMTIAGNVINRGFKLGLEQDISLSATIGLSQKSITCQESIFKLQMGYERTVISRKTSLSHSNNIPICLMYQTIV